MERNSFLRLIATVSVLLKVSLKEKQTRAIGRLIYVGNVSRTLCVKTVGFFQV